MISHLNVISLLFLTSLTSMCYGIDCKPPTDKSGDFCGVSLQIKESLDLDNNPNNIDIPLVCGTYESIASTLDKVMFEGKNVLTPEKVCYIKINQECTSINFLTLPTTYSSTTGKEYNIVFTDSMKPLLTKTKNVYFLGTSFRTLNTQLFTAASESTLKSFTVGNSSLATINFSRFDSFPKLTHLGFYNSPIKTLIRNTGLRSSKITNLELVNLDPQFYTTCSNFEQLPAVVDLFLLSRGSELKSPFYNCALCRLSNIPNVYIPAAKFTQPLTMETSGHFERLKAIPVPYPGFTGHAFRSCPIDFLPNIPNSESYTEMSIMEYRQKSTSLLEEPECKKCVCQTQEPIIIVSPTTSTPIKKVLEGSSGDIQVVVKPSETVEQPNSGANTKEVKAEISSKLATRCSLSGLVLVLSFLALQMCFQQ